MKYKITFKWETSETNIGDIVVEADSEEQALKLVSTFTIQCRSVTILIY